MTVSALFRAARDGDDGALASLIASGEDANRRESSGRCALHVASRAGHTGTVQLLLSHGAEVDAHYASGTTSLMLACLEGHAAVAEKLLEAGAQPNATTHDGRTALMAAAQRGGRELAATTTRREALCRRAARCAGPHRSRTHRRAGRRPRPRPRAHRRVMRTCSVCRGLPNVCMICTHATTNAY